jgi:dTDP-4-dehydrorhamnose reductase
MDVADRASVERALDEVRPWGVINAAGYVRVDNAESDSIRCHRENTEGPHVLAQACSRRRIALVTFSSDLVFDGRSSAPYIESDRPAPLSIYGWSKANAEARVLREHPEALVIRTSAFFGPWDEYNFVTTALRSLASGTPFAASNDSIVSPTYLPDLVEETLNLLTDGESGVWHLANGGYTTWFDFAVEAARRAGADERLVVGRPMRELGLHAPRPRFSALGSERGQLLPPLEFALNRYFTDRSRALHDRSTAHPIV